MPDPMVLIRQLQSMFNGRRPRGPHVASFVALAGGATADVIVTHGLGSTDVEVFGAIRLSGTPGEACSWGYEITAANTIKVWARNNGAVAATFEVRVFIAPAVT